MGFAPSSSLHRAKGVRAARRISVQRTGRIGWGWGAIVPSTVILRPSPQDTVLGTAAIVPVRSAFAAQRIERSVIGPVQAERGHKGSV